MPHVFGESRESLHRGEVSAVLSENLCVCCGTLTAH